MFKNYYTHPLSKKQWKKKKRPKLCCATKGKSCPDSCQKLWVPDGTACSLQSPHLVNNVVGPIFPLPFHQACHSQPSGEHFHKSVHGHGGTTPNVDSILNLGLVLADYQLEFVFANYFIITINSSESTYWMAVQCIYVLAIYIRFNREEIILPRIKPTGEFNK